MPNMDHLLNHCRYVLEIQYQSGFDINIYTSEIHFFINHYESFRHFKVSNCHWKSLMDAPRKAFCDFSIPLKDVLNDFFPPKSPN